jgi:TonB family protein
MPYYKSRYHIVDFMANAVYDSLKVAENMEIRKAIFWPVLISVVGHVTLIMATSMLDMRENVKYTEIYTVSIKEPDQPLPPIPKKEDKVEEQKSTPDNAGKKIGIGNWREDTIDLSSSDTKYLQYRLEMARKLSRAWKYPEKARDAGEQGFAVLKISINTDGSVSQVSIVNSSGSAILDEAALNAAKSAAPFGQLPATDLTQLHIFVKFLYELKYDFKKAS